MAVQNRKLGDTYTLLEQLGSGGGGIVYKAYHERLKTYVVVKQVKQKVRGILDGRAEADILKNIKHTYLPRVYDFLEIDGEVYTVMDFIPGKSLKEVLKSGNALSQKQVLLWARQLAEALDYLHRQNPPIIHSDIKPSNIMVTPEGNICLIDFNISLAFDRNMKTSTGTSAGYSPPEQYRDKRVYRTTTGFSLREAKSGTGDSADGTELMEGDGAGGTELMEGDGGDETESMAGYPDETDLMPGYPDETDPMPEYPDETDPMPEIVSANASLPPAMAGTGVPARQAASGGIPENLFGSGVDERSDVYSLGATLYHMLTGRKPAPEFDGIIPVRQMNPQISEGLAFIVDKMMALRPDGRYKNGGEVLYAFLHIYELDSEYRRYHRSRRIKISLLACLYAAGAALLAAGTVTVQKERITAYNRSLESAGSYMEEGAFGEAGELIGDAMKRMPRRIGAYREETRRLYAMGDYDGCIRYGTDVINNPVYDAVTDSEMQALGDIWYLVGNAFLENEDYKNAENCFSQAVSINPGASLYYRDYAIVLAKTGNWEAAEDTLADAVRLGLGEDSIYMVQGEIDYSKGRLNEAEKKLRLAITSAETDSLRFRAAALCDRVYRDMGNAGIDPDIGILQQAITQPGAPLSLKERLADAYNRKAAAVPEKADQYHTMALELFYELYNTGYATQRMMENIAILCQETGKYGEAEQMMMEMTAAYPEEYAGYKRLAFLEAAKQQGKENRERSYLKMKEYYEEAVKLYGKQEKNDPEMDMLKRLMENLEAGGWFS